MDNDHLPPLGPGKPWLVKDFPVSLREDITRAAAGQGATVGQWLVAHFQKFGIDGVEVNRVYPVAIIPGKPSPPPATALAPVAAVGDSPHAELRDLVEMARALTPPEKDSEAMRLARSMVRDRLRALRMGSA
jgi:hypothetical protein